jgi:glycosyltransferase involved in cell wall biosynthesis
VYQVDRSKIGIVIPAYNEEKTVGSVVRSVLKVGIPIVVDDGSCDRTSSEALRYGAVVVKHSKNCGYDPALNSGFKRAFEMGCDYIITMDADGQHNSELIDTFINLLCDGSDLVLGIRDKKQRIAEHMFAFLTKHYFEINDPLCGMKGYKTSVYSQLGHFDSFNSIGTELAIYGAINNFKITQVHIPTNERIDRPRFGNLIRSNFIIFRSMFITFINIKKSNNNGLNDANRAK